MRRLAAGCCVAIALSVSADDALSDEAFFEFLGSIDEAGDSLYDPAWLDDDTTAVADDQEPVPQQEDTDES